MKSTSIQPDSNTELVLTCRAFPQSIFALDFQVENWDAESWRRIASAFESADSCELRQSWRKRQHPHFLPAQVQVAWTPDALWVYAQLQDVDIFNAATQLNEETYRLGDAFEMFLHPLPGEEYFELHISPDNQKFQLYLPRGLQTGIEHARIPDPDFFQSRVRVEAQENRWLVLSQIPAQKLSGRKLAAGDQWLFSFSRYDYTRGLEKPVLSSTSAHSHPNFHDRHDWGILNFSD